MKLYINIATDYSALVEKQDLQALDWQNEIEKDTRVLTTFISNIGQMHDMVTLQIPADLKGKTRVSTDILLSPHIELSARFLSEIRGGSHAC